MQLLPALLLLLTPITLALPLDVSPINNVLDTRQSGSVTCGSTTYTNAQVSQARSAGCNRVSAGTTAGGYPHVYNNYEGFDFPTSSPWYEFPMLKSGVYTGGSPGADRVVFNARCQRAGEITHTGASGNNFVGCSQTS